MKLVLVSCIVLGLVAILVEVQGHGKLIDPMNRSSLWRVDPEMPVNEKDDELWCGGPNKLVINGGRCGVCGDDYDDARPRANENTGTFGGGAIMATYQSGAIVSVATNITQNHSGYIQFHLCQIDDPTNPETGEECFALLQFGDATYKTNIELSDRIVYSQLRLPEGVTCEQCTLRMTYTAGKF